MKTKELRSMQAQELKQKLEELEKDRQKQMTHRGGGSSPQNPGKLKEARRTIAKIKTILKEKNYE